MLQVNVTNFHSMEVDIVVQYNHVRNQNKPF